MRPPSRPRVRQATYSCIEWPRLAVAPRCTYIRYFTVTQAGLLCYELNLKFRAKIPASVGCPDLVRVVSACCLLFLFLLYYYKFRACILRSEATGLGGSIYITKAKSENQSARENLERMIQASTSRYLVTCLALASEARFMVNPFPTLLLERVIGFTRP